MHLDRDRRWSVRGWLTALALAALGASGSVPAGAQPAPGAAPVPSAAAKGTPAAVEGRPLSVVVSIPPLAGIVRGLLPAGSTVESLIPPGASEHGYEIPPVALSRAARADLVVSVGLGLEASADKFLSANPRQGRREVVFHAVAKRRAGGLLPSPKAAGGDESAGHEGHSHGPGESCSVCASRADTDPHFWLDPVLVRDLSVELSRVIGAASGPEAAASLKNKLDAQLARIDELHERYARTLAPATRRTIVVAHDAWQYPAARFGLRVVAIAGLNAQEPTPGAIRDAARVVREQGLTHVFIEPQLSRRAAERIAAATSVGVLTLDPLGDGDWFGLMEANLRSLATALGVPMIERAATPATPAAPATPDAAAPPAGSPRAR